MDDKQRKMRKRRIENIKELVTTEQRLQEQLQWEIEICVKRRAMQTIYVDPMKKKYPAQWEQLFSGIDLIQAASSEILTVLLKGKGKSPVIGELTDDNCMKASIGNFIRDTLNSFISFYKVFFLHAEKSLSYLNGLKEKDPFYKWLEDQRWHASADIHYQISLTDYLDRVLKRPGRIDLLLKTILDNTEPTNPDYGPLSEQYPKLKKLLLDLDRLIESRQNAELMNLLSNITPQTTILVAARRFVKQEVFTALVPCASGVKEQAMQFVLFDDLLLYGTMEGISYNLQGRFYLSAYCLLELSVVDSTVELEDDVIIMQDAEKSLYFFEREGGVCKGSVISMWFQLIENSILSTKKRHYICDVCNMNCEIMSDKSTPRPAAAPSSKGPLQAVICRGCGRVICSNCMVDMMSFQRSDADDKTVFCLHCRNNERSRWEKPSCAYRVRPSDQRWQRAVGGGGDPEFFYSASSQEVSWLRPEEKERLEESSGCEARNANWLTFETTDGRSYCWGVESNQVQWKQTMNSTGGRTDRFCPHCGFACKTMQIVCPKCNRRWNAWRVCWRDCERMLRCLSN